MLGLAPAALPRLDWTKNSRARLGPEFFRNLLALSMALSTLFVAPASLGTINHSLLSIEACSARGLDLLGVVISHCAGKLSDADARNLEILRNRMGEQLMGEVPPTADPAYVRPEDAGLVAILGLAGWNHARR